VRRLGLLLPVLAYAGLAYAQAGGGDPATAPAAPPPVGSVIDRVAAIVGEEVVTLAQVYAFGAAYIDEAVAAGAPRAAAERTVIERLIERVLVDQEMRALQLDASEADVDRSIDDIARRNGLDRARMREEIERSGMSWEQYRSELRQQLREVRFAQAVLRPRITITEDELRDAYRRATASAPATARVQAIFLAWPADAAERDVVRARARAIRDEALAGGDFPALSRANDQGPFGANGGEMGSFAPGQLVDTLDRAVTSTPTGSVSEPVETEKGVFLLRVAERQAAAAEFESVRSQLTDAVYEARMADERVRWFQQARRQAAIRILLPDVAAAQSLDAGRGGS
jgi:peptidyl-prolyl cis-trans isomerase SurA